MSVFGVHGLFPRKFREPEERLVLNLVAANKISFSGLPQQERPRLRMWRSPTKFKLWPREWSGGHMSKSPLRHEAGVEPHGAPRLAAVGPTCGGEKRREANSASPGLGRRSASPPPPAKVCSGRMRVIPPRHSAWQKELMCPPLEGARKRARQSDAAPPKMDAVWLINLGLGEGNNGFSREKDQPEESLVNC